MMKAHMLFSEFQTSRLLTGNGDVHMTFRVWTLKCLNFFPSPTLRWWYCIELFVGCLSSEH